MGGLCSDGRLCVVVRPPMVERERERELTSASYSFDVPSKHSTSVLASLVTSPSPVVAYSLPVVIIIVRPGRRSKNIVERAERQQSDKLKQEAASRC